MSILSILSVCAIFTRALATPRPDILAVADFAARQVDSFQARDFIATCKSPADFPKFMKNFAQDPETHSPDVDDYQCVKDAVNNGNVDVVKFLFHDYKGKTFSPRSALNFASGRGGFFSEDNVLGKHLTPKDNPKAADTLFALLSSADTNFVWPKDLIAVNPKASEDPISKSIFVKIALMPRSKFVTTDFYGSPPKEPATPEEERQKEALDSFFNGFEMKFDVAKGEFVMQERGPKITTGADIPKRLDGIAAELEAGLSAPAAPGPAQTQAADAAPASPGPAQTQAADAAPSDPDN